MKILSRRNSPATSTDTNGDGVVDERDRTAEQPADRPVVTDRDEERTTYRSAATATDDERARDAATDRDARDLGATTTDGRTAATTTDARIAADDERDAEARRRAADRGAAARAVTGRRVDADTRTAPVTDARTVGAAPAAERTVDLDRDGRPDRTDLDRDGRPDGTDTDRDGRVDRPEPYTTKRPRASLLATLGLVVSVVGALFVLSGTLAGYGIGVGAVGAVLAVLGLIATRRRHVAGKTDALIGIAVGLAAVVLGIVAMTGQFDWPTTDGDWVGRFREWLDSQFGNWF
ncbi:MULTISPECIES: thrombospondin [Micromonospora]|uniref:thrombospondin n=1 Tax=Micromonospora TaxID=1873 RepID=UPI0001C44832|nr:MULTISPECIES: thrombospondin [Micromonospora]ADU08610.1 Thrombospondin type 3 repeat-containing protein [Micromonospora sp. L5]MBC9002997.1 thrombospondin [Micromonospora aurantiaca]